MSDLRYYETCDSIQSQKLYGAVHTSVLSLTLSVSAHLYLSVCLFYCIVYYCI